MNESALGFLGVVAGSLITYLGVRFTARQARRATDSAATVAGRQVDIDEWKSLLVEQREVFEAHVRTLTDANAATREELAVALDRIQVLEDGRRNDRDSISTLTDALHREEARSRAALRYIRDVLSWVRIRLPDATPPTLPDELRPELI